MGGSVGLAFFGLYIFAISISNLFLALEAKGWRIKGRS